MEGAVECMEELRRLHEQTRRKRELWTDESRAVTDSLEGELDVALRCLSLLRLRLFKTTLDPGLARAAQLAWSSLVDLVYFQLHTRRHDLLQSLFSPKHVAPSAMRLLGLLLRVDDLLGVALGEADVCRQRYLLRVAQDELVQLRAGYLSRTRLQALVRHTATQYSLGLAQDPTMYCARQSGEEGDGGETAHTSLFTASPV